jgi:hypothetical protein
MDLDVVAVGDRVVVEEGVARAGDYEAIERDNGKRKGRANGGDNGENNRGGNGRSHGNKHLH